MIKPIIQQPASPTTRSKTSAGRRDTTQHQHTKGRQRMADENAVPTPESLGARIKHALAALKEGVVWDRGSIINLNI